MSESFSHKALTCVTCWLLARNANERLNLNFGTLEGVLSSSKVKQNQKIKCP